MMNTSSKWGAAGAAIALAALVLALRTRSSAPSPAEPAQDSVGTATPAVAVAPTTPPQRAGGSPAAVTLAQPAQPPRARPAEVTPARPGPASPSRAPGASHQLHRIDGLSLVHLGDGPPPVRPFGGRTPGPVRRVTGRVIDRAGAPVAGAIVLLDRSIHLHRDTVMTVAGTTTDATGTFAVDDAPAGACVAIALAREDWSELAVVGDGPVELRMAGHGGVAGTFTYDGEPEQFTVRLARAGGGFTARVTTGTDGRLTIPSLPPGRYTLSAGLAQSFGGGASRTLERDVTIIDGETTELSLAFSAGATVAVAAQPPAETKPDGLSFWLFTGSMPADGAEARARRGPERAPYMATGGGQGAGAVQFHDVSPGRYWACAGFFDARTMDALDRPFGCARAVVTEGDAVREVQVVLAP